MLFNVILKTTLLLCFFNFYSGKKTTPKNSNNMFYVANPIESGMPGSWMSLDLIKKMLIGSRTTERNLLLKKIEKIWNQKTTPRSVADVSETTIESYAEVMSAEDMSFMHDEIPTERHWEKPAIAMSPEVIDIDEFPIESTTYSKSEEELIAAEQDDLLGVGETTQKNSVRSSMESSSDEYVESEREVEVIRRRTVTPKTKDKWHTTSISQRGKS